MARGCRRVGIAGTKRIGVPDVRGRSRLAVGGDVDSSAMMEPCRGLLIHPATIVLVCPALSRLSIRSSRRSGSRRAKPVPPTDGAR